MSAKWTRKSKAIVASLAEARIEIPDNDILLCESLVASLAEARIEIALCLLLCR